MGTDFAILGELEVRQEGDRIELGSPRQRSLLARLLVNPNEVIATDRLVEDLWRGNPPEGARHTLHVYVSRLRKALGRDGARLERQGSGYRFCVEPEELDAARFEALATAGRTALARHDAATAATQLRKALEMWRGCAFGEFANDDFARDAAVRLDEMRLDTVEQRMWADLECGRHDEMVEEIREFVTQQPFRETGWEQLMLALYRSGRQADALRAYQKARAALAEELGIEPGPALRRMEERILAQDPGIEHAPEPKRAWIGNCLPLQRTSFIGREAELEQAAQLLGTSRLLTITGAPGAGKTRLALRVAVARVDEYLHGAFFVPLAAVAEPKLVVATIGRVLGLREVVEETMLDSVKAFMRDRAALLILDNFEHLIPAASEIGELLDAAPGIRIIATSRAPLGISGEQVLPLPPLAVPPADSRPGPSAVEGYDAVALFVARARAADPNFALTAENAAAAAEITARLDGLPLAIELAAARIKVLTPDELQRRLEQRLAVLTGGPADVERRHRTMRDAIAWSHELLDPEHKALFRRIAVFQGGFTLDAASAVADLPEMAALDGVDVLVSGSLLQRPVDIGEARYGMLEIVREYALEKLTSAAEEEETASRHARYFLRLATEVEPQLTRDPQGVGVQRLEAEVDNLRAALRYAVEAGDPEMGLNLAHHVWRFWQCSGRLTEGRHWVASLLELEGASEAARANGLTALAGMAYWQADYDGAAANYAEALELHRAAQHEFNVADTLFSLSITATWNGDLETGGRLADAARSAFEKLGSAEGIARVATAQGFVQLRRGDYVGAHASYSEGLEIATQLGDKQFAITMLPGVAASAFHLGRKAEALKLAMAAAAEAIESKNINLAVWMLDLVSAIAAGDEPLAATRLAGAADRLREEAGGGMLVASLGLEEAHTIAERLLTPEDLGRAWARGHKMGLIEATDQANALCRRILQTPCADVDKL
jgi:predicted ATPase/DNA-binding winged helix-turn-helix (wHTH) protein